MAIYSASAIAHRALATSTPINHPNGELCTKNRCSYSVLYLSTSFPVYLSCCYTDLCSSATKQFILISGLLDSMMEVPKKL